MLVAACFRSAAAVCVQCDFNVLFHVFGRVLAARDFDDQGVRRFVPCYLRNETVIHDGRIRYQNDRFVFHAQDARDVQKVH